MHTYIHKVEWDELVPKVVVPPEQIFRNNFKYLASLKTKEPLATEVTSENPS